MSPPPKPLPFISRPSATQTLTNSATPTLPRKLKPAILAISIALITATGAYYGASLKQEHQAKSTVRQRQESTLDERLERLRGMRARMEVERRGLVGKIEEVERRREGVVDVS